METDSHFKGKRRHGAPSAWRPPARSRGVSVETSFAQWPALQEILEQMPESRPGAVARARSLIADDRYPSDEETEILARRLALQLTTEMDSLPN